MTYQTNLCAKCHRPSELTRFRKYCLPCHAAYSRETRKKYSELPPEAKKKASARSMAKVYFRRGKIVQLPCADCGLASAEMHHEDYDKPLEIVWLCRSCHLKRHAFHVEPKPKKVLTKQRANEMRNRRKDLTPEEIQTMKQMEFEGKSRKEISLALRCSPSVVTRHLGSVRQYRGQRLPKAA